MSSRGRVSLTRLVQPIGSELADALQHSIAGHVTTVGYDKRLGNEVV